MTTMSTVDALLKEVYESPVREQVNQDVVALRRVTKDNSNITTEVGGKYVVFPVHMTRNSGIGARSELGALPVAGQQGHLASKVSLKYQYGTIQLTGQTMKLADSNYQAFASVLDNEVTGLGKDLAKNLNQEIYGDGLGGRATASANSAAGVVTCAGGTEKLNVGYYYDIVDPATGTPRVVGGNQYLASKTATTATFTVTNGGAASTIAVTSGDIIVITGSYGKEWTGLNKIIAATGSLQQIDPATAGAALWAGGVLNGSTPGTPEALTEARMIRAVDISTTAGGKVSLGLTTLGVRRAYFNVLQTLRQFVNTQEFPGGFSGLGFTTDRGDIPIVADVDAIKNTILFVDESELTLYREADWSWMDSDGSRFQRVVSIGGTAGNYDAYYATMYQYSELGTGRRNAHSRLNDITEA